MQQKVIVTGYWLDYNCFNEVTRRLKWASATKSIGVRSPMSLTNRVLRKRVDIYVTGDRRSSRRYSIDLPLRFKARRIGYAGVGKTLNISSHGIAFSGGPVWKPGTRLELSVAWPVRLRAACALQLVIKGNVVRSDERGTALSISHHEFLTHGSSWAFHQAAGAVNSSGGSS
jgi:hypothetical protein